MTPPASRISTCLTLRESVNGIFVKFVVEEDGDVRNVTVTENIDTPYDMAKKELILEAKKAVLATSGEWEPATIGGVPVEQWVDLPVKFNLENPRHILYNNWYN